MSSFTTFMSTSSSVLSGVFGALGGASGDGCIFTLKSGGISVDFPVSPPDFEVVNSYNNSSVNINNIGEINMLGKRGLATLKFSSFFPAQEYAWLTSGGGLSGLLSGGIKGMMGKSSVVGAPYEYVAKIKQMAELSQPCTISITGTDVSLPVTIDEFTYKEQDGSGDVYFSLALKEYRYIAPQSEQTNSTTGLNGRTAQKLNEKQTTVAKGIHNLDAARRAFQGTSNIAMQGVRVLGTFKAMVKSGGIPAGTVLKVTAGAVAKNGTVFHKF